MTNAEIDDSVVTIAAAIAKLMAGPSPADSKRATTEITGAGLSLLAATLKNLNDVARYYRSQTPPGAI